MLTVMLAVARRFGSAVLSVALIGGGFGLPLLDAVLFHSGRPAAQQQTRVVLARTGSPTGHAQVCILGSVAPQSRGLPSLAAQPVISVHTETVSVGTHVTPRVAQVHFTLNYSRAPPALPA
jgi:hypothetical protein